MQTVYDIFKKSHQAYAERPFIHIPETSSAKYQKTAVDYTYDQANIEILSLIEIYKKSGLSINDRCGLLLENRAEFFFHWLALNALGVSIVPLNGEFSVAELNYVISHSELELIITLPPYMQKLEQAAESIKSPVTLIQSTKISSLKEAHFTPPSICAPSPSSETECAMLYTSGSTGQPKGCVLSNEYFTYFGQWYKDIGGYCTLEMGKERLLTPLPLVHMNALACSAMVMMITGGCIIQLDRFHPKTWWKTVRETGATALHYLGVLPAILLNLEPSPDDKNHKVKFGFGAGVNPKHHAAFEERFAFPLIEAWAMTESGAGGCIIAAHEPRHVGTCCFGKPAPEVEFKLIDEKDSEVKEGEPGELLVRAAGKNPKHGFFTSYYKNDAATKEALKNGWLHTGDVVKVSPDGTMSFVDRRKNVIRRSGENISALEVETILSLDPKIDKVAAAPAYDEIRGDEVMACIVLKDGHAPDFKTAKALFDFSAQHLVYFKTPGYIAFVDELPLTASQKLKRGDMKKLCADLIDKGSALDLRSFKKRKKPKIKPLKSIKTASFERVAIVSPVSVPYERFSDKAAPWFFGKTLADLILSANIEKSDIDGLAVSSFTLAPDSVITLCEYFDLSPRWIEQCPFGGASGIIALRRAARAIQMGDANIIACIGADTQKAEGFKELVQNFSIFSASSSYPYGAAGPNGAFSLITQNYMDKYNVQREAFGHIALSQRHNAQSYKNALIKKDLTMADYLQARPIAGPLHLFDCVMPCAGAEGFLVMSVQQAENLKLPYAVISSAGELHNAYHDDPVQYRSGWDRYADDMFAEAELERKDIDLLYTYDDYPVISMMQMEDLGFCGKGDAAKFIQNNNLDFDTSGLVHNSSGGQLSGGQAGSAAGFMGVTEAVRQLTNAALGNAVESPQNALVSGYGMINYDRGLCSAATILKKGSAS